MIDLSKDLVRIFKKYFLKERNVSYIALFRGKNGIIQLIDGAGHFL